MMDHQGGFFLSCLLLVFVVGVGGTSTEESLSEEIPRWYRQVPEDSLCVYDVGMARATGPDKAVQMAAKRARDTLSIRLKKDFFLGSITGFTTAPPKVPKWYVEASTSISTRLAKKASPLKTEIREEGERTYQAYALAGVQRGKASKELLTYLQKTYSESGEKYVQFRASKPYQRLRTRARERNTTASCEF